MKCLVKKLPSSVGDESLEMFGMMELRVSRNSWGVVSFTFNNPTNESFTIRTTGTLQMSDDSSGTNPKQELVITGATRAPYIQGTGTLLIPKYKVGNIPIGHNPEDTILQPLARLKNCEGITGNVNLSHFKGSFEDLKEWAGASNITLLQGYISSQISGEISDLAGMSSLKAIDFNMSSGASRFNGCTWNSPTLRPTTYPRLGMYNGTRCVFLTSNDVDNYLINMAACDGTADTTPMKRITIGSGTSAGRTSASDAAVATLKSDGWTISINYVEQ